MTWLDTVLIVIWLIFLAVGARLGSLWTGACVLGGFAGACLADVYGYSAAAYVGGSVPAAAARLFAAGLLAALVPGYALSKITSALFLGVIDSAIGLVTGALTGFVAIALLLLAIVPAFPRMEKAKAWKGSAVARPLHGAVEGLFHRPLFRPGSIAKDLRRKASRTLEPMADKAADRVKDAARDAISTLKD